MHLSTKKPERNKRNQRRYLPPLLILIVFSDDRLAAPFHGQLSNSFGTPVNSRMRPVPRLLSLSATADEYAFYKGYNI